MFRKIISVLCLFAALKSASAQYATIYPTNWFVGMKWNKVQLIVKGEYDGFKNEQVKINYPGVQLQKKHSFENGKYMALDLLISPSAKPGNVKIEFVVNNKSHTVIWPLKQRRSGAGSSFVKGITSKDFIYLLMPDRFSNGDLTNDKFSNYRDTVCDTKSPIVRHGGDLQGIINHLDYFKELGVTALWLTPVIENDMPLEAEQAGMMAGYHGYWFTNHYKIDKRMGGEVSYKKLIDAAHANGIKIIQDAVYNHVGIEHWFYRDAPSKDWINQWNSYTNTNHRNETIFSKNGNETDKKIMLDGWFVPHLPDINQRNPFVSNYLIQHALWTVEEFGIDGWRVDTYKYCDEQFLNNINTALLKEYPTISIFGEVTANSVLGSAYFTDNNLGVKFKHNLAGVTDFPVSNAIVEAVNKPNGWTDGVTKLYMTLAEDLMYKKPLENCIFLDNHDMERFVSVIGEDMNKYKMAMSLLLTMRGIPQLYYGTEIWMKNFKDPNDGMVRLNFPGGFDGDANNKFVAFGRNAIEQEAFNYVKVLANFRKTSSALQTGKLMQWLPQDGLYVYFRYDNKQTIMVVVNTSDKAKEVQLKNYAERANKYSKGTDVLTNKNVGSTFLLESKKSVVLLLQ